MRLTVSSLSFNLDPYGQSLLAFFLLIVPAGLYIMGLYEDRKGAWLVGAGLVVHAFSILQRWAYTGLIPLSEKRDNISLMAFTMAAVYLYLRIRKKPTDLSLYALPIITTLIFVAIGHRYLLRGHFRWFARTYIKSPLDHDGQDHLSFRSFQRNGFNLEWCVVQNFHSLKSS